VSKKKRIPSPLPLPNPAFKNQNPCSWLPLPFFLHNVSYPAHCQVGPTMQQLPPPAGAAPSSSSAPPRSRWCRAHARRSTPPPPTCSPTSGLTSEVPTLRMAFTSPRQARRSACSMCATEQMWKDSVGAAGRRPRGCRWIGSPTRAPCRSGSCRRHVIRYGFLDVPIVESSFSSGPVRCLR
jgi:hypothetical protein